MRVRRYIILLSIIMITFEIFAASSLAAPLGDANGNGVLDLGDAIYILQTLSGLRQPPLTPYILATVLSLADDGKNLGWLQEVDVYTDSTQTMPITDAAVTINGNTLAFDTAQNRYTGTAAIAAGAAVNLSVTIGGTTFTATGTQYTTFPIITAPAPAATWQAARANTITWTAGAPTAGAMYLLGLIDSTGQIVYPAVADVGGGPLEVSTSSTSYAIPANSVPAGNYQVLMGIGAAGISNNTDGIPIANTAVGSGLWIGALATLVPITIQ